MATEGFGSQEDFLSRLRRLPTLERQRDVLGREKNLHGVYGMEIEGGLTEFKAEANTTQVFEAEGF